MSRIPYICMVWSGEEHRKVLQMHQKYGEVVRLAPDELSFLTPQAWDDVMGHRKLEQEENGKENCYAGSMGNSIVASKRADHGRLRRVLSHGFSAQAMLKQEPIMRKYIDLFIKRLYEVGNEGEKPVNLMRWYNFCTFDIVGDLAFGEPFDCLTKSDYHPWVALIFDSIKFMAISIAMKHLPFIYDILEKCIPKDIRQKDEERRALSHERVLRRINSGTPRPDFTESMVSRKDDQKMSPVEIQENAEILIIAGSETTATTLSGATYLLATNPRCLAKVYEEIRSSFQSEADINIVNTSKLEYTLAVLEETLRRYPPVAACTPRQTPPGGNMILGEYIPANTVLGVWHWPMYHSETNFKRPFDFCPERWLGDPEFNDRKEAFQPFSFGPRNCLGRNLAYAEMRTILARLIWNFDIKLADGCDNWMNKQKVWNLWDKPDLHVYLTPRMKY
ncbi:hypothetical protein N8I77_013626 [Diaporthe amygdali]|uniref:Uncharacterized protein n=1 Tax=Phomopsis amygdali TaxID=1214568 RepID=A0AAD9S197_PHOAM|nr:hypothetical protein N8I77_013626 [Diaporthe amygdali]